MSHRDLADLCQALEDNRRERIELEDAIARHPERIADVFAGSDLGTEWPADIERIIAQVERTEACSGVFDQGGRGKNIIEWSGYRYRVKGDRKEYWMRSGSNWCSSVRDWGEYGRDDGPDIDMALMVSYHTDRANALERIAKMSIPEAVAHLLLIVQGW